MAGFLSASTSMLICKSDEIKVLDLEKLRQGAFSDAVDPDGRRSGWTGMDDLIDTENFFMASCDSRYAGFSYRLDVRKPSSAVIRLKLAEKLLEAEKAGEKTGARARKELREKIIQEQTLRSPFVPSLTDCIWDNKEGCLFISTTSDKLSELILAHFEGCFGIKAWPLACEGNIVETFSKIQINNGLQAGAYFVQSMGSATLNALPGSAEKQAVMTLNNLEAISEALSKGLEISKIAFVATAEDESQFYFTLDSDLKISAMRLPRAEKGADREATFLINAAVCSTVSSIVEILSRGI